MVIGRFTFPHIDIQPMAALSLMVDSLRTTITKSQIALIYGLKGSVIGYYKLIEEVVSAFIRL